MVVGRIVWIVGRNLFEGAMKTEFNSKVPKMGKDGQQLREWGFGLAVHKSALNQCQPGEPGEIWAAIHQEAMTLFPNGQIPPAFAMKYKDGDTSIDDQGIAYSQREGYPGHLVFACKTSLPIKFFKNENGNVTMVNEGIKCGDYVQVQLGIEAHGAIGQGKAGLYLNPNAVMFAGYGKEIINTPSGEQIFGATPPPLPPGASAIPLAPVGMPAPAAPVSPAFPPMYPTAPAYPSSPAMPPQVPGPHHAVLPPAFQPPPTAPVVQAPGGFPPPPR
jgi:hypothetical protein